MTSDRHEHEFFFDGYAWHPCPTCGDAIPDTAQPRRSCLARRPGPHPWRQYQWRSDMVVCYVCGARALKSSVVDPTDGIPFYLDDDA